MCNDVKNWFVLYTKPRHEFKAEEQITKLGITNYLPTVVRSKKWSDRIKKVTEPVFSGYIFVHTTEKERIMALGSQAVVCCVNFNGKPAIVPPKEIDNLKKIMRSKEDIVIESKFAVGSRVKVTEGIFTGVEGIVYKSENNINMIAISIELLNRSVSVKLPADAVTNNLE